MIKKGRRFHTKEFKEKAVKLIKEQGYPVAEAARNLGVSPSILGRWKRELEKMKVVNPTLAAWRTCKPN